MSHRAPARNNQHLRLAHSRSPILTPEQFALFETPRTWAEIAKLDPRMKMLQWRRGIVEADESGYGFLVFVPARHAERNRRGAWQLTDKGRAYVARMSASKSPGI